MSKTIKTAGFAKRKFSVTGLQLTAAVVVFAALGTFTVLQSFAAKALSATLTAAPNPVSFTDQNASETFTGCGYQPNTPTTIVVNTPTAVSFFGGPSDATGCINITHNGFISGPGNYTASSWQDTSTTGKVRQKQMGATSFVVN